MDELIREAKDAVEKWGSKREAARRLGIAESTLRSRLNSAAAKYKDSTIKESRQYELSAGRAKDALRDEKEKRRQAEAELREARAAISLIEETSSLVRPSDFAAPVPTRGTATAVICANDWHAEERIDPDVIEGINEFDLDICSKRIDQLWSKSKLLIDQQRGISDIRDVVLWFGGDLINGYIHDELEESNFLGPAEAILFVQDHMATGVNAMLSHDGIDSVRVVCNYGNHGRSTVKRRISTGYKSSWEWLAYHNVANHYRNDDRVKFMIAKGYHATVDIQGMSVRFHHGDGLKYNGGVGGITIPVNKSIAQWNKTRPADYDVFGHWHQFCENWRWVSCGCLVGYNAYAVEIKADYQEPTQTFIAFDRNRGKVAATPIFVD